MAPEHEVLAVRYATRLGTRSETFYKYSAYGEPDGPLEMDYFFWVISTGERTVLVDSGFSAATGARLKRSLLVEPFDALASIGTDPATVSDVIVSHGHYDHIGNLSQFRHANVIVQRREFDLWTGPLAARCPEMFFADPGEVDELRRAQHEGRLRLVNGDAEILPGIGVRLVGGHCPGQQLVVVDGADRRVVLASDALHFYEEMERDMPFVTFTDLLDCYAAYETLRAYAASGATIVAGHDPLVMERYGPPAPTAASLAVRVG